MKNSSKFQFLAFGLLVLSVVFSVPSFAKGGRASGGGSGCRANFLADVKEVSLWFKANGSGLTPPLSEDQFASAVSLDDLIELPESMDLNYNGGPVTALYDGESDKIKIRCDRYNKENPIGRKRTVGHEVLRKIGREGDRYEISKLIFTKNEVAADLIYSLEKSVIVMKFQNDPMALVKVSVVKENNVEFFGFKECPLNAITQVDGKLFVAFEECHQVGSAFYKTRDIKVAQEELTKRLNSILAEQSQIRTQAGLGLAFGAAFAANGMLIYASDASAVWGFKQIGAFYDRNIARVMKFLGVSNLSHPRLMMVKGVMSIASIAYGLWAVNFSYDGAVADLKKSDANLQQNQVYLKSGGSAPFGLGVILDFSSFASSQQNFRSELKTIITETLITLEKSGILKGYNQF